MKANHDTEHQASAAELARLEAMIAARTTELRRLAALAHAKKVPILTREEIEWATTLGREAAAPRRAG